MNQPRHPGANRRPRASNVCASGPFCSRAIRYIILLKLSDQIGSPHSGFGEVASMGALLTGRRTLITGAGAGIGRATAIRFAAEGAESITLVDRDGERLERLRPELESAGTKVLAIEADLSDVRSVPGCVDRTVEAFGGVDIVLSNAGYSALEGFLVATPETVEKILAVNFVAGFFLAQAAARDMIRRSKSGVLLFTSAPMDGGGVPEVPAYAAAKAAVLNLIRSIGFDLAPHGIRVTGVAPGNTATSMSTDLKGAPEDYGSTFDRIVSPQLPLRRQARPEEMAAAFAFLASDEASYITGTTLVVDGGLSSRMNWARWWDAEIAGDSVSSRFSPKT